MIFIELEQGSEEWLAFRNSHITSTDASILLNVCPFKEMSRLYDEKMGVVKPDPPTPKMLEGQRLEPIARRLVQDMTGYTHLYPKVAISDDRPWQMASFDGISEDNKILIEIKCSKYCFDNAVNQIISDSYVAQMQHQLDVSGLEHMIYAAYHDGQVCMLDVYRDDEFIDHLREVELEFWNCLNEFRTPKKYRPRLNYKGKAINHR